MPTFAVSDRKAAPNFEATDSEGNAHRLTDYRGRFLVVFFYPKAFTPLCTKQTACFVSRHRELTELGAAILGVSRDEPSVQAKFRAEQRADFPLIADPSGDVSRAFGVARSLFKVAKRVTFVIDPEGRLAGRFHHELSSQSHVDDAIACIRAST